jgi:RNA polymerase sigma-70 factor, ECF subfamily
LLVFARHEVRRRAEGGPVAGPELDDLAHQSAADAMVALLAKLASFRGESRFTTWAYKFVVLEVSSKLGRHYWRHATVSLDEEHWERMPDRLGMDPHDWSQGLEVSLVVRDAVDGVLTEHQRSVFVAVVLDGVPLDALAVRAGTTRNALYKTVFDARRKIRAVLVANGYLEQEAPSSRREEVRDVTGKHRLARFLATDPRDVGCDEALAVLHVYVELVAQDRGAAEARYPGVAAHLAGCGHCEQDLKGLLGSLTAHL